MNEAQGEEALGQQEPQDYGDHQGCPCRAYQEQVMNEAERAETASKVHLKRVVKCKCGLEFNSNADRAAHIRKYMATLSKGVKSSFAFRPKHSNAPGTFVRPSLDEPAREIAQKELASV